MSGFLDQVKSAAATAANTATNLASQAADTTSNLASQAYNSQAAATVTETTKSLGAQALNTAGAVAGTVQQQAHAVAPSVIPAPSTATAGIDSSSDLEPQSPTDRAKLEKLFQSRPDALDLQEKGILKGDPTDSLAGKRAELEKSMLEDKLDNELASRPKPEDLVKKGILNADEVPPSN